MRVAIFIDGKNFYAGYKSVAPDRRIDFPKMARWLVEQVSGSFLWGVYYYTGVETGVAAETEEQKGLSRFLNMLDLQPGFFVMRFNRKFTTRRCVSCQALNRYSQEKEVDTTMVADMLRLAAVNAFDIMVLVSGDADHAPAVEGVRSVGKQAFVATWAGEGLSARSRQAAFDHIDLAKGVGIFAAEQKPEPINQPVAQAAAGQTQAGDSQGPSHGAAPPEPAVQVTVVAQEGESDTEFLKELQRAQGKFKGGYVGVNFFVTRWNAPVLTKSPDARRRILDRLVRAERVEVYAAPDGSQALRIRE
ncbi:MAG: NYN domain-containing protein [Thermoanaerobaculales bacterium]